MSAVLRVEESSPKYLAAPQASLVQAFDQVAKAPGSVARLRELILSLAVRGQLVRQCIEDEPASSLLRQVEAEKERLIANGEIKQSKTAANIAENELPFSLPSGWQWVRLGTVLKKIGAGSTPLGGKQVYVNSGVKFLRSQNVWNDGLRLDGVAFIDSAIHARMAGTVVTANDLLFNITGASIGRCAVVPADFDEANVSQHVTIIRPVLPALNAFLHTVLISPHVQQTVMDVQVGVSREGLSIAKLSNFLVPIPPLSEQTRIVARVDELMGLCDALEAKDRLEAEQHARLLDTLLGTLTDSTTPEELTTNWQRVATHFDLLLDRPEAVDALEQTILQLAIRGVLCPQDPNDEPTVALTQQSLESGQFDPSTLPTIPPSWKWICFNDLIDERSPISYGVLVPGPDVPSGVPFVRIADLSLTEPSALPEKRISTEVDAQYQRTRLNGGEILMGVVGSIGKLGVAPASWAGANIARAVCRIVPRREVNRDFVLLLLQSEYMQSNFAGDTRTLAQPTLNVGLIRNAPTPLPPSAEQARIVARVTELRRLCADLRQRLAAQQTVQSHLADALVESALA